jgi:putative SOS response-associated peptidase YedK
LPSFSDAFRNRRCIIPASGFYEWRTEVEKKKKKIPQRFHLATGGVMGFAAIWDKWLGEDGKLVFSAAIITTSANEPVTPCHDRMPAILTPDDYAKWFEADADLWDLHALLKPYPASLMTVSEANVLVNSPKNEGPQLLDPAA